MQASEKLNFIPDTELKEVSPSRAEIAVEGFVGLCQALLAKFPEGIRDTEVLEDDESFRVFESPLRVTAEDGSYLHILVFGHAVEEGTLDLGINLTEHSNDGVFRGGYIYTYDHAGFTRQKVHVESEEDPFSPDTAHFSLIDRYHVQKQLSELEASEDIDMKMIAHEVRAKNEERIQFEAWENQMGFDGHTPTLQEVRSLAELLLAAEPYEPPTSPLEY